MTVAGDTIREIVLKIEALDAEREKVLANAEGQGLESELIEVVVSCRKFEDEYKQANINLPQEYIDAMKPTARKLPGL